MVIYIIHEMKSTEVQTLGAPTCTHLIPRITLYLSARDVENGSIQEDKKDDSICQSFLYLLKGNVYTIQMFANTNNTIYRLQYTHKAV